LSPDEMIANGIRVDELSWHLKVNHFEEYVQYYAMFKLPVIYVIIFCFRLKPWMDTYSAQWLSGLWANNGKPKFKRPEWEKL
jgi:hypothetical protein